jgi:hypothetical protein
VIGTLDARRPSGAPRQAERTKLRWFFPVVASLLLAGLVVGFAKTFCLRSQFSLPSMPSYLYGHGIVLTSWFVLVLAQTSLVAAHRTDLHRRLGFVAVAVAVLLIPISAFVVVRAAHRSQGAITPLLQLEVVDDFLSLVCFAGFAAAGVYFRRRPDVHKRLMIAACFTIYGPYSYASTTSTGCLFHRPLSFLSRSSRSGPTIF